MPNFKMHLDPPLIWNPRIDSTPTKVRRLISQEQVTKYCLKLKTKVLSPILRTKLLPRRRLMLPQGETKTTQIFKWIKIFIKSLQIWTKTSKWSNIWSKFRLKQKIVFLKINKIVQKVVIIKETKRIIYRWAIITNIYKIRCS